jgi:hypothetical protein
LGCISAKKNGLFQNDDVFYSRFQSCGASRQTGTACADYDNIRL